MTAEKGKDAGLRADADDDALRVQYEAYPYPPRDPADEATRLVTGSPGRLAELNHYLFAGRRDFSRPFRALIAGGGTGDATIMLAQQLADIGSDAEIVYLDLSHASAAIARARADARGLANIRFLHGSILELGRLAPGPFDYIDCCGVLHHMADPVAGLRALNSVLADDGGMGLMVYAPYGRTGVYHAQSLLRMVPSDADPAARVQVAKKLLATLPPTNWLRRNPYVGDHIKEGDAGLYDLLLHSCDRSFSVPEVGALTADAGLRPVSFIEPIRYDPAAYINDPGLAASVAGLSWIDRCAFAELLTGNLKTHVFYVVKSDNAVDTVAHPDDGRAIPLLLGFDAVEAGVRKSSSLRVELDGLKLSFPMSEPDWAILRRMDGHKTIDAIYSDIVLSGPALERAAFDRSFSRLFSVLNGLNLALLGRRG